MHIQEKGNARAVFVYGTLMKGQRAEAMLAEGEYVGDFRLEGFAMYHLGSYPGICPCPGETVYGEAYLVSDSIVEQLDRYEREGELYDRKAVTLLGEGRSLTAEAYVYRGSVTGCPRLRRRWQAQDTDPYSFPSGN